MKRFLILCSLPFVLSAAAEPLKVCINEVQSSNDQTLKDAHGESPDWVELYNGEATNVDLTGWALTDKPDKPKKWWKFPAGTTIEAGKHLVVLADSTEQASDDPESAPMEPNDESLAANLVAWYRADDVAENDGTSVSSWADQSGRGNNATQSSTARPTLKKNAVGDHAALQFTSASSQCLKLPFGTEASGLTDMADVTVIIVGKLNSLPTSSSGYSGIFDVTHPSPTTTSSTSDSYHYNTYLEIYGSDGKLQTQSGNSGKKATSASEAIAVDKWYAFGFTTRTGEEDTATTLYLNGGIAAECEPSDLDKTAFSENSVAYLGNTRRKLGKTGSSLSTGSFFNGLIAEVVVFNRALAADEYARVSRYLSEKYNLAHGGADELHASFSISGDGETLALFAGTDKADEVTFSKIPCDRSYGRKPDGEGWTWFAEPTPGGANDKASYAAPMLEPVVFSHTRGLCESSFQLTLSHPSKDVKIVYTTDHSEPTEESPEYTGPITVNKTTIVRAAAFRAGCVPCRNVTTHTYLFINTVVDQTPEGTLKWYPTDTWKDSANMPAFVNDATGKMEYRSGGSCKPSYTVSTSVIKTDADRKAFVDALKAAPIVSVTLPDEHLFGKTSEYSGTAEEMGILSQPNAAKGVTYQADAEWLTGTNIFATPIGFTAHGMYARRFSGTPKISLRFKFRGRFNASTLDVPVFADAGFDRDEFKSLVLRGEVNNGWQAPPNAENCDPAKATSMMDQFVRDLQQEMSGYSSRGTYVHLFLNGLYWGLYNMAEQASDDFASQTWSGDLDHSHDYNIVVGRYDSIRAGTDTEYKQLKKLVKGGIDTPETYAAVAEKLDLVAYADYMLLECFVWNDDWPGNNYAAISSGKNGVPCRFVAWDAERACLDQNNKDGKTKSWPTDPTSTGGADLHVSLAKSTEWKQLLADRAQKFLFNGGALTAEALTERYRKLAERVRPMLFADAARWGAYRHDYYGTSYPMYGLGTWDTEKDRILDWLSERGEKFLAEMKNLGFYPDVAAASVSANEDRQVTLTVPAGATVWYTTDGSDPREMFATATPSAAAQSTATTKTLDAPADGMTVKARVLSNGTWSALTEVSVDGEVETRNVFIGPTKDENWSVATNWSYGTYPNAAGATAVITDAGGFSGKGKRSIYVTEDVTVGELEFRNGDKENDIEQGEVAAGDLTFAGAVVTNAETGAVSTNNASITVADKASTGHAEIGLGKAHVVHLGTDLTVTVDNTVGSEKDGGLRLKGVWDGGGHDLKKLGAGRLTISFTNAADTVFGKLQAEEGVIAIEKPIHVTEITKKGGTIYLPVLGTDGEPAPFVVVDGDINENLSFGLFVPSVPENEGEEIWCTGGIRAGTLPTKVTVYVPDEAGSVFFADQRWSAHPSPSIEAEETADGSIFKVNCPKIPAKPAADVVINEVQSSNDQTLLDDREESPDWVELWNREGTNVDLSGWVLTDKPDKPEKWWRFPQGSTIKAGEHLVVYADSTGLEDAVVVNPLAPNADSLKGALVAWYDADDFLSIGNWTDHTGHGFTATRKNGPTLIQEARNEHNAVRFAADSSQRFEVPVTGSAFQNSLTNLADVTVIVIGKWNGTVTGSYVGLFGVTHGSTSYNTGLQLGSDGALRLQYSSTSSDCLKSTAVMAKDTWSVAAFTTQKAGLESAKTKLYLNGECVAEGTPSTQTYSTKFGSSSAMYIGASPYRGTSTVSYFNGDIAEVIIYNRALTSEECLAVYKSLNEKYNLAGDAQTYHHTSFSIGASGETLTLFDPASVKADEVTFGKIPCDTSYGRVGDGETWAWFADPTPKSANGSVVYDAPLEPVVFSRERGVFTGNETVTVELSNANPLAKIYYTTDRSEPTASSTPYEGPITIKETTNLRATAILDGHLPYRNVTTHSYIWLDKVEGQKKPNSTYPDTWTDVGSTIASYGPSATILSNAQAKADFVKALTNAPIVSVTLSDEALFGSADGLYIHPNSMEEREPVQADVEWVTGDDVFGLGVGLDMHGAYSRRFDTTPKKSFKLKFSGAFGAGSLDRNVLASGGGTAVEYKKLVLRAENNHSWTSMEAESVQTPGGGHPELGQSMVDQFFRNTQKLASGFQAEGTHVHLFLNGLYWGLYNLTDHVCDAFAASTFCTDTDPEERMDLRKNFDVIKNDTSTGYAVRDGSDAEYEWIKSNVGSTFASAGNFAEMTNRFDISSYIDYLLIEWYIANEDWPGNNWVMAGSRKLGIPMRFVLWDSDKSVREADKNLVTQGDSSGAMAFHNSMKNATGNAEYKLMFADRIQKLLFDEGGALTTESVTSRYRALSEKVETYVFAESARWGAYIWDNWDSGLGQKPQTSKFSSAFDMAWWYKERDRLTGTWFPNRYVTFTNQLTKAGLWGSAQAKVSKIEPNDDDRTVTLSIPSGTGVKVYYTLDGSDPHKMFAATATKSDSAMEYAAGTKIELPEEGGVLKVRALANGAWSALTEQPFEAKAEMRNELIEQDKDATWTKDASWSLGYYPNAAGAIAIIGAPTAGIVSKKGQRKVTIGNEDGVTVGRLEFANGDYTNRIEAVLKEKEGWYGGDLRFCGVESLNDKGKAETNATIAVMDADGTVGQAVISLDSPWMVRLDSDLVVSVTNTAAYGGLRIEGAIAGNGHDLAKWGPGRMTLAATNATGDVFGNLQCNEGILAVEAPLHITSVTKETGTIWLKLGGTDIAAAFESALVCDDKLNKTKVGLFVPTTVGSDEESFFGGAFCAEKLSPGEVTIYVQNPTGDVVFCGERWQAHPEATHTTEGELTVESVKYLTFKVKVPYFGPPREPKTVRFDAAGGLGAQALTNVTYNEEFKAPACSLWNLKRSFGGWKVVSGGVMGETVYQPGDIIPDIYKMDNPQLVAQWEDRPSYPTDEPDMEGEIRLTVGESTNLCFKSRLNLRHWLIGSTNGFSSVTAKLSIDAVPTADYAAYQLRTTNVANEVTLTLTGAAKGSEDIFFARQYKLQEPEYAAKFRVIIGD